MKNPKKKADPVRPEQSGRMMPIDPLGTNAPREERVRLRAYQIYQSRGREDGHAEEDWFRAEADVK